MRSCYLCKRKKTEEMRITLHRFPKIPDIRKKWIQACGLHGIDVSRIVICSCHFDLPEYISGSKRLRLSTSAVPTKELPVQNHPVPKTDNTNISKSSEGNITSPIVSDGMDSDDEVQITFEASTCRSYSEKNVFPSRPRERLFVQPRYISEICVSDFSTPKKTKGLIDFIKKMDIKKRNQIKYLREENRKLLRRVAKMEDLIESLNKI